jgi:hypothetical protein
MFGDGLDRLGVLGVVLLPQEREPVGGRFDVIFR